MGLRLAIIGLGAVTRNIHLPAYKLLGNDLEVVGGCDVDADAREEAESHFPVFQDAAEMLRSVQPEIVAVCTPPSLHLEQTLLALDSGCHVFCEKPMAPDLRQAHRMNEAAARANRSIVINTQFPLMDIYRAAYEQFGTEVFGRLQFMHVLQTFRRSAETEAGWRGELRRRLCFEFGVHVFSLARYFFEQDPETILAHMPEGIAGRDADDVNTIALGYEDGRGAAIVLNRLNRGPHRYLDLTLDGEYGTIRTSIGGQASVEAGISTSTKRPFIRVYAAGGGTAELYDGDHRRVLAREGMNPFAAATARNLSQFMDAVSADQKPDMSGQDHLKLLALSLAAYRSAETGSAVRLDEFMASELNETHGEPDGP